MPVPLLPNGLPRRAWRVAEVAEMLGISEDSVYRLLADGSIAWIPARNLKLIPVDELDRYIGTLPEWQHNKSLGHAGKRGRQGERGTSFSRLSPEAIAAAREVARGFKFSSEQKQLIADLMTPLLEQWAAEGYPGR